MKTDKQGNILLNNFFDSMLLLKRYIVLNIVAFASLMLTANGLISVNLNNPASEVMVIMALFVVVIAGIFWVMIDACIAVASSYGGLLQGKYNNLLVRLSMFLGIATLAYGASEPNAITETIFKLWLGVWAIVLAASWFNRSTYTKLRDAGEK